MNNNEVKENRCFYLEIDGSCQCYHTALSNLNQIYYCKDIINCYYKQLIQLKIENEQLTQKLENARDDLNTIFATLEQANNSGLINDTIWVTGLTTLWDLIQQALKEVFQLQTFSMLKQLSLQHPEQAAELSLRKHI